MSSGSANCQTNVSSHICTAVVTIVLGMVGTSTKTHTYWSRKSCDGDAEVLEACILNTVKHYRMSYILQFDCTAFTLTT